MDKAKTFDRKRKRNESKLAKLRVMENEQKIARAKREGTYKPGGNILGFDDDDNDNKEDGKPPAKKPKTPNVCCSCGMKGHKTARSTKCLNYVPKGKSYMAPVVASLPVEPTITEEEQVLMDANDLDEMDALPLDDDFYRDQVKSGEWVIDDDNVLKYSNTSSDYVVRIDCVYLFCNFALARTYVACC